MLFPLFFRFKKNVFCCMEIICSIAGSNRRPSAHKTDALTNWAKWANYKTGDNRESNPGPSAPKAEIIPLDYYPLLMLVSLVLVWLQNLFAVWNYIFILFYFILDNGGFDPPTSRMLSVRSTNWASRPLLLLRFFLANTYI